MNKDLYTCKYVILGKYTDSSDYRSDLEDAVHLAKAFALWCELDQFDPENNWLTLKIAYVSDMVFSSDLLRVIKFFALFHGYSIMRWEDEIRPLEND